jgi:hypothetical protein
MNKFFIVDECGTESLKEGVPLLPDMFMPEFDDTELENQLWFPSRHPQPWTLLKGKKLDVCYHLNYVNFDYAHDYRGLRIVSSNFAELCEEFKVNFEFIPVNVRLRRRGVNKRKAKLEDFNVSPQKEYGIIFLTDERIYAMDFEKSKFCIERDKEGKAILNPKIPYKHEIRFVYDYVVDPKLVSDKHFFKVAEAAHGAPRIWNVCSEAFSKRFVEKNLLGAKFLELNYAYQFDLSSDKELDPRCWILDKGEEEVFFQPEKPRPPRPKLPG